MKVSEVVKKLDELLKVHGDLTVTVDSFGIVKIEYEKVDNSIRISSW